MLDDELQLVRRAVGGEAPAFGLLYDHYQPKIYRFVFVQVGRREEAEDLTHQVFLKAWTGISGYRDFGYPFGSWLYRIARNQVIDHYRTKKQNLPIESLDQTDEEPRIPSVEHSVADKIQMDKVSQAIRSLKPAYRDVILMRYVEELSVRETALAIGKSEGAVKLIQHRALKQLRDTIDPSHQSLPNLPEE